MVRTSPRLMQDVDMSEEVELRRLEDGMPIDGAAAGVVDGEVEAVGLVENQESTGAGGGDIVQGAAQRRDQLVSKMFSQGGFRPTAKITGLLPHGGSGLKMTVPKRREFGPKGNKGDAAHEAAMKQLSVKEFGSTIVQGESIDRRMQRVGLFGYWLEKNEFGEYLQWQVRAWMDWTLTGFAMGAMGEPCGCES